MKTIIDNKKDISKMHKSVEVKVIGEVFCGSTISPEIKEIAISKLMYII